MFKEISDIMYYFKICKKKEKNTIDIKTKDNNYTSILS